jgi:hypothetical protein
MAASPDHLAISSDVLRAVALSLVHAKLLGEAATALLAWQGVQVARRGDPVRLAESDAMALDFAHRAYSNLLPRAIRGEPDLSVAHIGAVLAAMENIYAPEIEDTEATQAALLRLSWRAALNARRIGRRVVDKMAWIVGGKCDPNEATEER